MQESRERDQWTSVDNYTYVRFAPGASPEGFVRALGRELDSYLGPQVTAGGVFAPRDIWAFRQRPVSELIFETETPGQLKPGVDRSSLGAVRLLALFLGLVLVANFINYAVLIENMRSRITALRRTFGETRLRHMLASLGEYGAVALACLAAAAVTALLLGPFLERAWGMEPIWSSAAGLSGWLWPVAIVALLAALGIGLSALWTRPQSLEQLFERSYTLSRKGHRLRTILFGVHVAGTTLIVATTMLLGVLLNEQMNRPSGIALDDMRIVRNGGAHLNFHASLDALGERARAQPGVSQVAFSSALPGETFVDHVAMTRSDAPAAAPVMVAAMMVTPEFLATVDGRPAAGRFFSRDRPGERADAAPPAAGGRTAAVILSETAAGQLGFRTPADAIGATVSLVDSGNFSVIGVVPDWRYEGVLRPSPPFIMLWNEAAVQHMLIRADPAQLSDDRLRAGLEEVVPNLSAKYQALEPVWAEQFQDLRRLVLVGLFISGLIFATLVLGTFAFAAFMAHSNRKLVVLTRLFGAGGLRQILDSLRGAFVACALAVGAAILLFLLAVDRLPSIFQDPGSAVATVSLATALGLSAFIALVIVGTARWAIARQQPAEILGAE